MFMFKLACFLSLLLIACGRPGQVNVTYPVAANQELSELRALYLTLTPTTQDADGFVDFLECDSLLHTGLLGAGGVRININAARDEQGQWFRRPLTYPECLASGGSKSTISRDMVLGLMWYWYETKNWEDAEAFLKYAVSNNLIIGSADGSVDGFSRTYMTPNMMALLAELIYRLGGPNHYVWRNSTPRLIDAALVGYKAHLEVLSAILWGRLTGSNTASEIAALEAYLLRSPDNALRQYALGHSEEAAALLLEHHPGDRLPTDHDFCNPLRYESENTGPCITEFPVTHAPIHFLLISKWILEE